METWKTVSDLRQKLKDAAQLTNVETPVELNDELTKALLALTKDGKDPREAYSSYSSRLDIDIQLDGFKEVIGAPTWRNLDKESAAQNLQMLYANKYNYIMFSAYTYAANNWERETADTSCVGMTTTFIRINVQDAIDQNVLHERLTQLSEINITKDDLKRAVERWELYKEYYTTQIHRKSTNDEGISKFVNKLRGEQPIDHDEIRDQFAKLSSELKGNWLTARTWGFEVEVPDAKGVNVNSESGIEKGEDGSLRSYEGNDECECDCDDCCYHECDCEYCSTGSSDPDHCGSSYCTQCDSAEFRTTGGIQRGIHSGLVKLSDDLITAEAENNDTAGVHIHVYAADLNMQQVAQVVAIYAITSNVLSIVARRENVNYAMNISMDKLSRVLDKTNPKLYNEKPIAVNLMHLPNRGTIEFRQMACNFDWREITVWAALVRGIVNAAKRGATYRDFKQVNDLNEMFSRIAKFNHEIGNENAEELIYGSRTDKAETPKNTFIYA